MRRPLADMHLRGGILVTIALSLLLLVHPVDAAGKQLPTSKSEVDRQNDNNEKNDVTTKAKPNDPEDLESQEWHDNVTFEDIFRDEDDGEERHLNHRKNDNIETGEENKTAIKKEESRGIFHRLVHALGFSQNNKRSEGAQSDDEMKSSGEQPDPDNIEANPDVYQTINRDIVCLGMDKETRRVHPLCGGGGLGGHGHIPHGHRPHSHDPHGHTPHSHDPHGHIPHSHDPHSHAPHGHNPHSHDPHSHNPHGHSPHSHNPHGHSPHSHNPHSHAPHGHSPHSHSPHSHAPHGHNPHSHTPLPTKFPTRVPTKYPSPTPTKFPTPLPTPYPTPTPTRSPTKYPTPTPTKFPTPYPTPYPTPTPTRSPTKYPTPTPTRSPTATPTLVPTTRSPSSSPKTERPTIHPTSGHPYTHIPTRTPTTLSPSTLSPATQSPSSCSPSTRSPLTFSPTSLSPSTHSPSSCSPTSVAPSTLSPTSMSPTSAAPTVTPTTCAPTSTSPTSLSPTSLSPSTCAPTSTSPTSLSPTSLSPSTCAPSSASPSEAPTTASPTMSPSTGSPLTEAPTTAPTSIAPATVSPSSSPLTMTPSCGPSTSSPLTVAPSNVPTTMQPSHMPTTLSPATNAPSVSPTTIAPSTCSPITSTPTEVPTCNPTSMSPVTGTPTLSPSTVSPTTSPSTVSPATESPSQSPTSAVPSQSPSTLTPTTSSPKTGSPTTLSPSTVSPTSSSPTTTTPTTMSPSICFRQITVQATSKEYNITRDQKLTISAGYQSVTCAGTKSTYAHSWTQTSSTSSNKNVLSQTGVAGTSTPNLYLPPSTLTAGARYCFNMTTTMRSGGYVGESSDRACVSVSKQPVSAVIGGGSSRYVSPLNDLILDATMSYDPDNIYSVPDSYVWSAVCQRSATSASTGSTCAGAINPATDNTAGQNNPGLLQIPAEKIPKSGCTCQFGVRVGFSGHFANAEVSVEIAAHGPNAGGSGDVAMGGIVEIPLSLVSAHIPTSMGAKINPGEVARVVARYPGKSFNFSWTIRGPGFDGDAKIEKSQTLSPLLGHLLVLRDGVLLPSSSYVITANAHNDSSFEGRASFDILTLGKPYGSECGISPRVGVVYDTQFSVSCSDDWQDPDGMGFPVVYRHELLSWDGLTTAAGTYSASGNNTVLVEDSSKVKALLILRGYSPASFLPYVFLPIGDPTRNYTLPMRTKIRGFYGTISEVYYFVRVAPPPAPLDDSALEEMFEEETTAAAESGDVGTTTSSITNLMSVLTTPSPSSTQPPSSSGSSVSPTAMGGSAAATASPSVYVNNTRRKKLISSAISQLDVVNQRSPNTTENAASVSQTLSTVVSAAKDSDVLDKDVGKSVLVLAENVLVDMQAINSESAGGNSSNANNNNSPSSSSALSAELKDNDSEGEESAIDKLFQAALDALSADDVDLEMMDEFFELLGLMTDVATHKSEAGEAPKILQSGNTSLQVSKVDQDSAEGSDMVFSSLMDLIGDGGEGDEDVSRDGGIPYGEIIIPDGVVEEWIEEYGDDFEFSFLNSEDDFLQRAVDNAIDFLEAEGLLRPYTQQQYQLLQRPEVKRQLGISHPHLLASSSQSSSNTSQRQRSSENVTVVSGVMRLTAQKGNQELNFKSRTPIIIMQEQMRSTEGARYLSCDTWNSSIGTWQENRRGGHCEPQYSNMFNITTSFSDSIGGFRLTSRHVQIHVNPPTSEDFDSLSWDNIFATSGPLLAFSLTFGIFLLLLPCVLFHDHQVMMLIDFGNKESKLHKRVKTANMQRRRASMGNLFIEGDFSESSVADGQRAANNAKHNAVNRFSQVAPSQGHLRENSLEDSKKQFCSESSLVSSVNMAASPANMGFGTTFFNPNRNPGSDIDDDSSTSSESSDDDNSVAISNASLGSQMKSGFNMPTASSTTTTMPSLPGMADVSNDSLEAKEAPPTMIPVRTMTLRGRGRSRGRRGRRGRGGRTGRIGITTMRTSLSSLGTSILALKRVSEGKAGGAGATATASSITGGQRMASSASHSTRGRRSIRGRGAGGRRGGKLAARVRKALGNKLKLLAQNGGGPDLASRKEAASQKSFAHIGATSVSAFPNISSSNNDLAPTLPASSTVSGEHLAGSSSTRVSESRSDSKSKSSDSATRKATDPNIEKKMLKNFKIDLADTEEDDAAEELTFRGALHEMWREHPWTSMFSCGPDDEHNGFERLCSFCLMWSISVAMCGFFYGSGDDMASTWVVGMISVFMCLPFVKLNAYLLSNSDSIKRQKIRARDQAVVTSFKSRKNMVDNSTAEEETKEPRFSLRIHYCTLLWHVVLIAFMTLLAIMYAIRFQNLEGDLTALWIASTLQGQCIDAIIVEPFLVIVLWMAKGRCELVAEAIAGFLGVE